MNNRVLIIAMTTLSCFAVGAGIIIAHAPDGGDAALRSIGILFGLLSVVFSNLMLLGKQAKIKGDTEKMLNGVMDAKIQTSLHKVLRDTGLVTEPLPNPVPNTVANTTPDQVG